MRKIVSLVEKGDSVCLCTSIKKAIAHIQLSWMSEHFSILYQGINCLPAVVEQSRLPITQTLKKLGVSKNEDDPVTEDMLLAAQNSSPKSPHSPLKPDQREEFSRRGEYII